MGIIQALTNNFHEATFIGPGSAKYREAWGITLDAAEAHNDPGKRAPLYRDIRNLRLDNGPAQLPDRQGRKLLAWRN